MPLRRLERVRKTAIYDDYIIYLQIHEYDIGATSDPAAYKEAISSPQSDLWIDAMNNEMNSTS